MSSYNKAIYINSSKPSKEIERDCLDLFSIIMILFIVICLTCIITGICWLRHSVAWTLLSSFSFALISLHGVIMTSPYRVSIIILKASRPYQYKSITAEVYDFLSASCWSRCNDTWTLHLVNKNRSHVLPQKNGKHEKQIRLFDILTCISYAL